MTATAPRASEHQIQSSVIEWAKLAMRDVIVVAIPNAGKRSAATASHLKKEGMVSGTPDLIFVGPGSRAMWIEMKSDIGRMEPPQQAFRDRCLAIGALHRCCRSLPEVITACRELGWVK